MRAIGGLATAAMVLWISLSSIATKEAWAGRSDACEKELSKIHQRYNQVRDRIDTALKNAADVAEACETAQQEILSLKDGVSGSCADLKFDDHYSLDSWEWALVDSLQLRGEEERVPARRLVERLDSGGAFKYIFQRGWLLRVQRDCFKKLGDEKKAKELENAFLAHKYGYICSGGGACPQEKLGVPVITVIIE